jgi:pre-mRNA cleavage complex 2 protein Pcf11
MNPADAGSLLAKMVQGGGDISALLSSIAAAKANANASTSSLGSDGGGALAAPAGAAREGSPALLDTPTGTGGGGAPPPPKAPPGKPSALAAAAAAAQPAAAAAAAGDSTAARNDQPRKLTAAFDPATEHGDEGELRRRREFLVDALYGDRPHQCAQTGRRFAERGEACTS